MVFSDSVPQSARMDEATSRGRTSGRRMASAKATPTSRPSRNGKRSPADAESEISPARWAGVALVIAALLGAIVLAVVSPSEQGSVEGPAAIPVQEATPSPTASGVADTRLPVARPEITDPSSGMLTSEWVIEIGVKIPPDELRKKDLKLVVLRGDEKVGEKEGPPKLGGRDVVPSARLAEGLNELTVALEGPGGLGPRSEPIEVTLDRDLPPLSLISPENRSKTFEGSIDVSGTSEPGATVRLLNSAADFDSGEFVVGRDGAFDFVVELEKGRNQITAESRDEADRLRTTSIVVTRKDGKPVIELRAPKSVRLSSLPKTVNIVVDVKDTAGDPMPGAVVNFYLQGVERLADQLAAESNDAGRAKWSVIVEGGSREPVGIAVTVTSPYGQTRKAKQEIEVR